MKGPRQQFATLLTLGQALVLVSSLSAGCMVDAKPGEDGYTIDGKLDVSTTIEEHGALSMSSPAAAVLSPDARFHFWELDLTDIADLHLWTSDTDVSRGATDTVIYLLLVGLNGYELVARNDDSNGLWSAIDLSVPAGKYEVVVKGYYFGTYGPFALNAACEGPGCPDDMQREQCSDGRIVAANPMFYESAGGLECQSQNLHCVTENASACPRPAPPRSDWCTEGRVVQGAPTFIPSSDGLECQLGSLHCVTRDESACPRLAPRPPGWCAEGTTIQGASSFIPSADGLECELPALHCITRDASACSQIE